MKEKLIINLSIGKVYLKFLLAMKLTFLLLTIGTLSICAETFSQNEEIGLDFKNVTIREALDRIEKETGYKFFYLEEHLDDSKKFSMNSQNYSVPEFLSFVFSKNEYKYKIFDDKIVVITPSVQGDQELTITGVVTDISGNPLPGVNIIEKGTTNGSVTNIDGAYSITVSSPDATLSYSFIGYLTEDVAIAGQTTIDISLVEDILSLEEVVVTGYSIERKKDIIGSVTVIDTDEMQKVNSATVGNQLQGRAAGVFVQSDGSPEGTSKIRIRGFGSFGGSDPLYIVDGVPISSDAFNSLNPNDVESIQVLKDAASASVYGARAANGVIIVSTKKGQKGKTKVSVTSYSGVNYVSKNNFPELLNAQEYGELWWASNNGAGITPSHAQYGSGASPVIPEYIKAGAYGGAALESLRTSDPGLFSSLTDPANYDFETHQIVKSADTDWFDELFNPATVNNVQLGVSGGSESGTYSISLNYFDQNDVSNEFASFKRYTARANSMFNVTKFLTLGENLQVAYSDKHGSGTGADAAWKMNPIVPVWDEYGNPAGGSAAGIGNSANPIAERWRDRFDKTNAFNVFGNVYADVNFFDGLVFHTAFGIDYMSINMWDMEQQTYENAENTSVSTLAREMNWNTMWTWTNTLTFNKKFGSHAVKVMLGTEAIRDFTDYVEASRQEYNIDDNEDFVTLATGIGAQSNYGEFNREMLASMFARFDYAYADKYLMNATLRRDGSSKFGKNNRYGIFPAIALGWRISEESFLENVSWLDDLKLRSSYGIIGNQNGLGAENQYTQYNLSLWEGYAVGGGNNVTAGYQTTTIGNANARWEKSITSNVGFDATILNGKFDFNFEYYIRETKDLLVENQAPFTGSNAEQPDVNVGNMTNKGFDFNITHRGKLFSDLSYEASVNFSHYKNEVNRVLDSDESFLIGSTDNSMGVITRTEKGYPFSYIWGYQVDGFFESETEAADYASEYSTWITPEIGRWRIKDISGPDGVPDKVIDEYDRTMIGSPHPDFQVGFNFMLNYKNFDLSTFIFWNQGGQVYNLSRRDTDMNYWSQNRSKRMLYQSWDPTPGADNSDALLPKLDISDSETLSQVSDYFVEDVTYVRMKTLQLGYSFNSSGLLKKMNIERLRIYVQAQNLFTAVGGKKPFTGLDPDASLAGEAENEGEVGEDISMGSVHSQNPTPKQFVIGLNIDL